MMRPADKGSRQIVGRADPARRPATAADTRTASKGSSSSAMAGKGERKREQLLLAAAKVLAERGYAGTTMADIAELAGTQAGSIYYHFASREELIEAVLRRGVTLSHENTRAALAALPPAASTGDRLRTAIRAHVRFQVQVSDFGRASARSTKQVPTEMQVRVIDTYRDYGALFDGLIRASIAAGDIAPDVDPSALRMLILGAANWIPEWFRANGRTSADEIGELLVRMVFQGVSPR